MKSFSLKSRPGDNGAELITRTEMDYESAKKRYNIIIRASSLPLRNDVDVEIHVTGNEYKFFFCFYYTYESFSANTNHS